MFCAGGMTIDTSGAKHKKPGVLSPGNSIQTRCVLFQPAYAADIAFVLVKRRAEHMTACVIGHKV